MPKSVLVTYATKYGSTREVAEVIADALGKTGLAVDLKPAAEAKDVAVYDAVVLGSPLYIGRFLKDANAFLEHNRSALESRPVALFALGPVSAQDDLAEAYKQIEGVLGKIGWLKPTATAMFVGAFDPARLRGLDKLVTKPAASPLHNMGAHDERDWVAIRAWADSLPAELGLE